MPNVFSTDQGRVRIVEIDRPETRNGTRLGLATAASGEPQRGAAAFTEGKGRHCRPVTR